MKTKPVTPYERLIRQFRTFANEATWPRRVQMFSFAKDKLTPGNSWRLDDVYQRALAAKVCGYSVEVRADADGMSIEYVKARPDWPDCL